MKRSLLVLFAVVCVGGAASPVLAHGERGVEGNKFTVGWANEPAFIGQLNAVQLFVEHDGSPALGLENTLKVEVSVGGLKADAMKLRTVFESPGEYRADLIPTAPGGYTFRFFGKIEDESIDESFSSPKDGFDEVEGTSAIAFPKAAPATSELADRIAVLDQDFEDAKSVASMGRTIGIVGIALGLVALVFALRRR